MTGASGEEERGGYAWIENSLRLEKVRLKLMRIGRNLRFRTGGYHGYKSPCKPSSQLIFHGNHTSSLVVRRRSPGSIPARGEPVIACHCHGILFHTSVRLRLDNDRVDDGKI